MLGPVLLRARGARALGLSLALGACAPKPAAGPPEAAPGLVETAPAADGAAPPALANDTSLELPVYRAAGVPDLEHAWSVDDYQRCLKVLVQLTGGSRADLPRYGSPRSGALFAQLVDARNFEVAPGLARGTRARELQRYLEVYPGLLRVYSPASDGIDFSAEQVELIAGVLELLKSALDGSAELVREDPDWAPTYQAQQATSVGVVRGLHAMLAERQRYSELQRQRLKAELGRVGPGLERHLAPEAARELHALDAD